MKILVCYNVTGDCAYTFFDAVVESEKMDVDFILETKKYLSDRYHRGSAVNIISLTKLDD